jgi:hypothetical protein
VHPAGGGVPGRGAEQDLEMQGSGQAVHCLPVCPSKTVSRPAARRLPRVFPHFCLSHPDFPLHS